MSRVYPALRISFFETPGDEQLDLLSAELDDFRPTAINEIPNGVVAFFGSAESRDAALGRLEDFELVDVVSEDVPDEHWAERSQAALTPVTVGSVTVAPPWAVDAELVARAPGPVIVIQPSMGFGTGHHASTRLCLDLLQRVSLAGARVLDIGTGSGVLALAARILGATEVVGVDIDTDALDNARDNLALNPAIAGVEFREFDLSSVTQATPPGYGVIVANLTGGLLQRDADRIGVLAAQKAQLIVSGFQVDEAPAVFGAFQGWTVVEQRVDATWVGAHLSR